MAEVSLVFGMILARQYAISLAFTWVCKSKLCLFFAVFLCFLNIARPDVVLLSYHFIFKVSSQLRLLSFAFYLKPFRFMAGFDI